LLLLLESFVEEQDCWWEKSFKFRKNF